MSTAFQKLPLPDTVSVSRLVSFFYFEFAKDFIFPGERHNFWEFIYIDKGEVNIHADSRQILLKQGQIYFHKPNEFHAIFANKIVAPNICVIAFECKSEAMSHLENALFQLNSYQLTLISLILKEGVSCFQPPLDNYTATALTLRPDAPFAALQTLKDLLELFFIDLIRCGGLKEQEKKAVKSQYIFTENHQKQLTDAVIAYMKENIPNNINVPQLCRELNISKTSLSVAFKNVTGCSLIEYFTKLKMDAAKKLIREENYNVTQIAQMLGFGSVHYFSRRFKALTSMSPSEYAKSIKAKAKID